MDLSAHAVVLATRNRPTDVERTLRSVARAEGSNTLRVVLVDGSDPDKAQANQQVLRSISSLHVDYHPFPGDPAASRQRNYGVEVLPASIRVVHFIDDDVEVHPQYFTHLADTLPPAQIRRLFLLDGTTPGVVLPSGHTVPLRDSATGLALLVCAQEPAWPNAHCGILVGHAGADAGAGCVFTLR